MKKLIAFAIPLDMTLITLPASAPTASVDHLTRSQMLAEGAAAQ